MAEEQETTNSALQSLLQLDSEEAEANSGLTKYKGLRCKKATDYHLLPSADYKRIREQLDLAKEIPPPPTNAAHSFLLANNKTADLRHQFEANWNATATTHAAVTQLFQRITELISNEDIKDEQIKLDARRALLLSANATAHSLETYRYLVKKQAIPNAQKPGNNKDSVLTNTDIHDITSTLETKAKIQRLTKPNRQYTKFFKRTSYRNNYRGQQRGRGYQSRGAHRFRGRGRGRYPIQSQPQQQT